MPFYSIAFIVNFRFPVESRKILGLVMSSKGYILNLHAGISKKTFHGKKTDLRLLAG